jgi:hypothetical protein
MPFFCLALVSFTNSSSFCAITRWYSDAAGHGSREVACFLFARSEAVTVGSNPTQGMDV